MKRRELRFLSGLAWKNLSRYRKRTVITAISIAAGIGIFIFMDSWLLGADKESFRNLIWYETGSAKIVTSEYWDEMKTFPLKYTIQDPEPIITAVENTGYQAAPRVMFSGEIIVFEDPYPADGSIPARFTAIDPVRDRAVFRLHEEIVPGGRYLEPGGNGILLGAWLADTLNAKVGYPITVSTRTKDGGRTTIDLEVLGLLDTPNPLINRGAAYIDLGYAEDNLVLGGAVTEIAVSFPENEKLPVAVARIKTAVRGSAVPSAADLTVKDWKEVGADYVALSATKSQGSWIILFLIGIIAAVGISNTMLMAVYERIREIGMMRAMGMKDREIRLGFILEAAGIGLLGSVAGLILGTILTWWVVTYGIDFTFMLKDFDIGYRVAGVFRGAWNPLVMILSPFIGIAITMITAVIPSRRAVRKSITECLRFQ